MDPSWGGVQAVNPSTEHAFRFARLIAATDRGGGGIPDGLRSWLRRYSDIPGRSHIVEKNGHLGLNSRDSY
jgi:hypothetical protein